MVTPLTPRLNLVELVEIVQFFLVLLDHLRLHSVAKSVLVI